MRLPRKNNFELISLFCSFALTILPAYSNELPTTNTADSLDIKPEYCQAVLTKVDDLVSQKFFDAKLAQYKWKEILARYRTKILASKNYIELGQSINSALRELRSSHTEFLSINNEAFYFIKSLFTGSKANDLESSPSQGFTGLGVAGVKCANNVVRYVLDGSPAAKAGFRHGDCIEKVDGAIYKGQSSFINNSDKTLPVQILRDGKIIQLKLKPEKKDYYSAYVEATAKSVKKYPGKKGNIGYVHLWCGGQKTHDLLEELLEGPLHDTVGLILDLRDGYGGNSIEDLDYFYRPSNAYPLYKTFDRNGKLETFFGTYSKPLVVLINGGSRSGKELLAYSLKKTHRGTLVGEKTAGYVRGGQLFNIDNNCALYLAVLDGTVDGQQLEGKGVSPDIEVVQPCSASCDQQLLKALKIIGQ